MDLSSYGSRKKDTLTKSIKNHLSASVRLVVVDSEEELVLRRLFRNISFILIISLWYLVLKSLACNNKNP